MKVLKDPFLISIVGVSVLAVAILAFLNSKGAAGWRDESKKLTDPSQILSSFAAGKYVNVDTVDAKAKLVEGLVRESGETKGDFILQNRRKYRVMALNARGRVVAAFPVNEELYKDEGLEYDFARRYQAAVRALLASMDPASAPTADEIDAARKEAAETGTSGGGRGISPVVPPVMPPSYERRGLSRYAYPYSPLAPGREETTQPVVEVETPQDRAVKKLIVDRSKKGSIYASDDSMYYVSELQLTKLYSFDRLWALQVGLWIQQDIVTAINLANRQAGKVGGGVPGAAVKRLVETNVRGYVVRDTTSSSRGGGRPPVLQGPAPLMYLNAMAEDRNGGGKNVPQLTKRACNELYDVVHYDFTVVLPAGQLLRLFKNLTQQNYHTIVNVVLAEPGAEQQAGMSYSGTSGRADEGSFYYGMQSVVQATIVGELLLLTDWERGLQDTGTGKRAEKVALMPDAFLKMIWENDPEALRSWERDSSWAKDREGRGPPR